MKSVMKETEKKLEWCSHCEDYVESPHICYIRALRDKTLFYSIYEPEDFDAL